MFTVVSYDVVCDRRRARLARLLNGRGRRVQDSVFECDLSREGLARLHTEALALIDATCDSVRCYVLDRAAVRQIVVLGVGEVTREPAYYLADGGDQGR